MIGVLAIAVSVGLVCLILAGILRGWWLREDDDFDREFGR
jgi:hypothetical protein